MDTPDLFRIGDRVQLIVPLEELSWGRSGVIRRVYFPIQVYRVLFDEEQASRLVYGPDLVRETAKQASEVRLAEDGRTRRAVREFTDALY